MRLKFIDSLLLYNDRRANSFMALVPFLVSGFAACADHIVE